MKRRHCFLVIPTGVIALVVLFVMLLSVSVVTIAHAATTVKLYTKASSKSHQPYRQQCIMSWFRDAENCTGERRKHL